MAYTSVAPMTFGSWASIPLWLCLDLACKLPAAQVELAFTGATWGECTPLLGMKFHFPWEELPGQQLSTYWTVVCDIAEDK